jgi:lipooligosaccharide transport system ATP-binding protein
MTERREPPELVAPWIPAYGSVSLRDMPNDSALVVRNLRKVYQVSGRPPLCAVDGISFEIRRGECFGLLGPNGAGKSTSMNCVTGFYPPTEGEVRLMGIDVHKEPRKARRRLGVCSQEDTLDSDFTVLDQMIRYGTYFGQSVNVVRPRAEALLRRFGLIDKSDDLVEALSGGMRRRLQVARALISEPEVLILDEPTTGLDPEVRRVLWDVIGQCRAQGVAILLSTHYMEEAHRLCDRVAILHRGKILDCEEPQELIARHVGEEMVEEEIRPGVRWKRPSNLEDVYLKLTGKHLKNGDAA